MTRCRHRVQRDRVETLRVLVGSPFLNHTKWNLPLPQQTRSITIPNLLRTSRDHPPLMTSMDNFIKQFFVYSDHIGKTQSVCARPKIFYFGHHALCTHLPSKTAFSTFATVRHIYYLLVTTEKSETSLTTPGLLVNIVSGPRGLTGDIFEPDFFAERFFSNFCNTEV